MLKSQISSLAAPTGLDAHLLDDFAKETGFVVRNTGGFSAGGFLLACLKAVSTGKASFRALARCLVHGEAKALSRQALHYRSNHYRAQSWPCAVSMIRSATIRDIFSPRKDNENLFSRNLRAYFDANGQTV